MSYIFIELYNAKPAWNAKTRGEQDAYIDQVLKNIESAAGAGVEVVALGRNAETTPKSGSYDFFCVYRLPSAEAMQGFAEQIELAGWYDNFDQVNLAGPDESLEAFFRGHVALGASPATA